MTRGRLILMGKVRARIPESLKGLVLLPYRAWIEVPFPVLLPVQMIFDLP